MSHCFISHAAADRVFVEGELLGLCRAVGVDPWYARESIQTGEQWERSILAGLEASEWFIVVMSQASALSEWVKNELAWAMDHRPGRIIPLMIQDCAPTDFHLRLSRLQYIDFHTDPQQGRERLITLLIDAKYRPIRRANAIVGNWTGHWHQHASPHYPEGVVGSITVTLNVNPTSIEGSLSADLPYGDHLLHLHFTVTGGFFYERFLQIIYTSTDPGAIQFGSAIMELGADGRTMSGHYVGYGAQSESIVTGRAELTKSA